MAKAKRKRNVSSTHTFTADERDAIVESLRHLADHFGCDYSDLADRIEARTSERVVERIPHTVIEEPGQGSAHGRLTDVRERHESFGLVGVSRLSYGPGENNMFGSHMDRHPTTFRFTVQRATRQHSNLAYDRYHSDGEAARTQLLEFEVTATQFVDLLTSLNQGEGVPCTIRRVLGETMDDVPPDHKTERQLIRERFADEMRDVAKSVRPLTDSIEATLRKRSIGKGDREQIRSDLTQIVRVLSDHAPWVMRQFSESTDRLEIAGKAEVEAYAESVIRAAGLEHLRRLRHMDPDTVQAELAALDVAALPAGEDDA